MSTNEPISFRQVLNAASFAARAHDGHRRKDKQTPYVSHVFRVCLIVRDLFGFDDPRMLCAALLHDTLEDTKTDHDELAEQFSPEVADWVALLSKDKRLAEADREKAYVAALSSAPWQVQACKLADVYDNLSDLDHFPPERRQNAVQRVRHYLDCIAKSPAPQLKRALQLTSELWHEQARKAN